MGRHEPSTFADLERKEKAAKKAHEEAEQNLRLFIISRAYRRAAKPWPDCDGRDLPNEDGNWDLECQLPAGHGRWHQEWSEDGRLLGEWS